MKTTRRTFLGGAAALGSALGFPALVRGQNLNSRLAHACIGTGGKGYSDWQNFIKHPKVDIVAGCDVVDREAWSAVIHGVAKNGTRQSD